jgi:Na+/H+-dicarboxylate symporter
VADAFAKGEILQVLLFPVLFGFGLHQFGGRGTLVFDVVQKASHVLFVIVGYIMKAALLAVLLLTSNGAAAPSLWRSALRRSRGGHVKCGFPAWGSR